MKQLLAVLHAVVVARPEITEETPRNICADADYAGEPARLQIEEREDTTHVRLRGEARDEKAKKPDYKLRR